MSRGNILISMLLWLFFISEELYADDCDRNCTINILDFRKGVTKWNRSRAEVVFGGKGFPVSDEIPVIMVGRYPFIRQKYVSIVVKSNSTYRLSKSEIDDVNACIKTNARCVLPSHVKIEGSGRVIYEFDLDLPNVEGIGRSFSAIFVDGLDSRVVLRNFNGRYVVRGASVRKYKDEVIFDSIGNGELLVSEVPDWSQFANSWKRDYDADAVNPIARELFADDMPVAEVVRIAREWIAKNMVYEYKPQTIRDLTVAASLRDVVASRKSDCKGLAVFLQALLASAGVKSQVVYTRIGLGKRYMFDSNVPIPGYFDHVILYVPELGKYYDPTLRLDQLGEDISDYLAFSLNTETSELTCFLEKGCGDVPRYLSRK